MGEESFSNRGYIASNPHDLFVFNFFSLDLVNSSDTDWNLNCGIPRSRPLRLLKGTVCLLVCPSDLKRRSTTPVKKVFKALAIWFLPEVGLPSMFIVGTELFVMVPGMIFFTVFQKAFGSSLLFSTSFTL